MSNDDLLDSSIRHQVWLLRYGGTVANDVLRILDAADRDLVAKITERVQRLGPLDHQRFGAGLATSKRLDALLEDIRALSRDLRRALESHVMEGLRDLTKAELEHAVRRLIEHGFMGVDIGILRPSDAILRELVTGAVLRGQTLRSWFKKLEADRLRMVESATRLAMVEGDNIDQLRDRLTDTLDVSKRRAEALVRTSVNAVANRTRETLYQENADLLKGVRWVATLDSRTSPICSARDGMMFDIGEGPRPPAHPNCRSTITPVVKSWDEMSGRNTLKRGRGGRDLDALFRKKLREKGLSADEIKKAVRNGRSSIDGQVPGKITYAEWLRRQTRAVQNDLLGKQKARLFRDGKMSLDRFVDLRTGRPVTLGQLAA